MVLKDDFHLDLAHVHIIIIIIKAICNAQEGRKCAIRQLENVAVYIRCII